MSNAEIQKKISLLSKHFKPGLSTKEISLQIMDFSKTLPPMREELKTKENQVMGCQSTTYLASHEKEGRIYFEADSDALISRGIAAILVFVYSGQELESVIHTPPDFAKDLGILSSLSLSRAGGLASMFSKIKFQAICYLSEQAKSP